MRRQYRRWEQERQRQAQSLLNAFCQTEIEINNLTIGDHNDIVALTGDPRFKSLVKLMVNIKNRFLKNVTFGQDQEMSPVYRGGAMAISAILTALSEKSRGAQEEEEEKVAQKAVLDAVGW